MGDHVPDDEDEDELPGKKKHFNSYVVKPGKVYLPVAESVYGLPPGFYQTHLTYEGIMFRAHELNTDEYIDIPGSVVETTFKDMKDFLAKRNLYSAMKLTHKRGYLLHGPPGTGKTAITVMLGRLIVESGGIVIMPGSDDQFVQAAEALCTTEAGRPLMFILEEISSLIDKKDNEFLSVLDGEGSPDNCVFVATTNSLSSLNANITNRPGRFARVILVDYPNDVMRSSYAVTVLQRVPGLTKSRIQDLAKEIAGLTYKMSLDHVRDMIVAHLILGQDLGNIAGRFKDEKR